MTALRRPENSTRSLFRRAAVNISVLLLFSTFSAVAAPANAQQGDTPFCLHTEPFAPNGVIVRMGEEYYRTCRRWSTEHPWRHFLLKMNPALVQDLFSEFPPTSLTIFEDVEGTDRLASSLRLKEETGNLFLGGVEYTRYDSSVLGPNGNPNSTVLVFDPEADGVVPRHWVSCRGQGFIDEGRIMTCYVSVPQGSVIGELMFIGSKERGFEFTKHFADFAQDIVKTLDAANVTNKLEYYSTFIDVVE